MKDFDLRGKDYLTELEAAHYCGVSPSQFRAKNTVPHIVYLGKKLYRKTDIQAAIEKEWHRYTNVASAGTSNSPKKENVTAIPSVQ